MKQAPTTVSHRREILTGTTVVIVIAILFVFITIKNKPTTTSNMVSTTKSSSSSSSSTAVAANATFKDGTYSAVGPYEAPGEKESITVTLTLASGVVTDSSIKEGYQSGESQLYQDQFVQGYKQLVVGKKITSIKLSRVAASSLTSQGFNDAVQQIEKQALVS
jgi:hypothetical protein